MTSTLNRRCEVLLTLQNALLGEVSTHLRAVTTAYDETNIHFDCYFDGEASFDVRESMSVVATNLIAAFPQDHEVSYCVHRLDFPALIPKNSVVAYRRKESAPENSEDYEIIDKGAALMILKAHEAHIRSFGVASLWLFEAVAKGTAHAGSDVDLFCDYDTPRFSLIDLIKAEQYISDVLLSKVDLATRGGLRPDIRDRIEATALKVF